MYWLIFLSNIPFFELQLYKRYHKVWHEINQHAIKNINAPYIFAGRKKTNIFSPQKIEKWCEKNVNTEKIVKKCQSENIGVVPTSDTTVMNCIVLLPE
jgi:hypothetical protein